MTAAIIVAALALGLSAVAAWLAVLARSEAITCRRELSSHRRAHAEGAEERRATARHRDPEKPQEPLTAPAAPSVQPASLGPATEALVAQDTATRQRPAVALPRPGKIGGQR